MTEPVSSIIQVGEDSNHSAHQLSIIGVLVFRMKKLNLDPGLPIDSVQTVQMQSLI